MKYLPAVALLLSSVAFNSSIAAAERRGLRRNARFQREEETDRNLQENDCCEYQKVCDGPVVDSEPDCHFICVEWCNGAVQSVHGDSSGGVQQAPVRFVTALVIAYDAFCNGYFFEFSFVFITHTPTSN